MPLIGVLFFVSALALLIGQIALGASLYLAGIAALVLMRRKGRTAPVVDVRVHGKDRP